MPEYDADGNELTGLLIADAIVEGEYDDALDTIGEAIHERYKILQNKRARLARTLPAGTRVKLVNVSPKAANGQRGTLDFDPISGKMGIRLDHTFHGSRGRVFRADHIYTWPPSCYEQIDA
jgi:hypothetical protein